MAEARVRTEGQAALIYPGMKREEQRAKDLAPAEAALAAVRVHCSGSISALIAVVLIPEHIPRRRAGQVRTPGCSRSVRRRVQGHGAIELCFVPYH